MFAPYDFDFAQFLWLLLWFPFQGTKVFKPVSYLCFPVNLLCCEMDIITIIYAAN